jgi:hypothetical protein
VAWLFESGFLAPHVAPSPRAIGEAVAVMIRSVRAAGLRLVPAPPPAPEPPPPQAGVLSPPAAETEELADEADAPPAPPATRTNGAEFDVEGEARAAYFEKLARATS